MKTSFLIKYFLGPNLDAGGGISNFGGGYFEIGALAAISWWRRSRRVTLAPELAARRRSINTGSLVRRPSGDAAAALTPTKCGGGGRRLRPCALSVKEATFGSDLCCSCNFNAHTHSHKHRRGCVCAN
jgi:hypothetical protein